MIAATPVRLGFVAIFAAGAMVAAHDAARAQGPGASVNLAPHIAIYDLKRTSSRGKRALESVRGRIVYDFSGSACDGYALNFRQVTELDSGEGKVALSDLRTATAAARAAFCPSSTATPPPSLPVATSLPSPSKQSWPETTSRLPVRTNPT